MYYSGRVVYVLFEDISRSFYILKMELDTGPLAAVSVKGYVPGLALQEGTWFGFEATESRHPKFGRQLNITKAPIIQGDWDIESAHHALVANGVGVRIAQLIRDWVGDDLVKVLGDPEALKEVPGLDEFTALHTHQRWKFIQAYFKGLDFLLNLDIPPQTVARVWATLGDDVQDILSVDPWSLVKVEGISFQQADEIASKLGLELDDPNRMRGAVLEACKGRRGFGHLYLTTGQLFSEVSSIITGVSPSDMAQALAHFHKEGTIKLDREVKPGMLAIYEPWAWDLEFSSAEALHKRVKLAAYKRGGLDRKDYIQRLGSFGPSTEAEAKKARPRLDRVVRAAIEEWGGENNTLSKDQKQGVFNALTEPISVLTGLPGTGKTTSLRAVVSILQDAGVKFLLCAPTGIAAKNLGALAGSHAYTIHRAFQAKGVSDENREATYVGVVGETRAVDTTTDHNAEWGYGPKNPYPAEVVIVDEASMVDQHLMYRLLTCTSAATRLVFVGDAAQLPSVGPGNVLRDLVRCDQYPVVALTEIFRQKDTSDIVYAAHAIYRGEVPNCEQPSDFTMFPVATEEDAQEIIVAVVKRLFDRREDFQVLSPRHAGGAGVTNLNARLRDLLNPGGLGRTELKLGSDIIRDDDRVMVVKNNYRLGVYNGDVGKVTRIDLKAKEIEIKVHGDPVVLVRVPLREASTTIRLAYACTVHKAQGLEYDVIVMPLLESFRHQLQRNLLYTAVTRARHKVILVGTQRALARAVINDKEERRNTLFHERLIQAGGSSKR